MDEWGSIKNGYRVKKRYTVHGIGYRVFNLGIRSKLWSMGKKMV